MLHRFIVYVHNLRTERPSWHCLPIITLAVMDHKSDVALAAAGCLSHGGVELWPLYANDGVVTDAIKEN